MILMIYEMLQYTSAVTWTYVCVGFPPKSQMFQQLNSGIEPEMRIKCANSLLCAMKPKMTSKRICKMHVILFTSICLRVAAQRTTYCSGRVENWEMQMNEIKCDCR